MNNQPCTSEDSVNINLKFLRHAEKTKNKDEYPLTIQWQKTAKELWEILWCTVVASSPVERAQLTASYLSNPNAENNLGFKEHQAIKRENNAPRVRTVKEIWFNMWKSWDAFYEDCMAAYKNNALSRFYIEESDKYLEKDPMLSTYTTVAWNFAELILKYCEMRNKADDIRDRKQLKNFNISKEVNRLFVSHGWTLEFLLYKVIEDKEWREWLLKFIEENHLEMQVNYLEWYNVKITKWEENEDGTFKNKIELEFRGKKYEITEDFLNKLVNDRDELLGKKASDGESKE